MNPLSRWRDGRALRDPARRARYGEQQLGRLDAGKRLSGRQFYLAMEAASTLEDREREVGMIADLEDLGVIAGSGSEAPGPARQTARDRSPGSKLRPGDPGYWQAHHAIVPDGPGDFTPVTADEHHGEAHVAHGPIAELLTLLVPALEDREAEAGG